MNTEVSERTGGRTCRIWKQHRLATRKSKANPCQIMWLMWLMVRFHCRVITIPSVWFNDRACTLPKAAPFEPPPPPPPPPPTTQSRPSFWHIWQVGGNSSCASKASNGKLCYCRVKFAAVALALAPPLCWTKARLHFAQNITCRAGQVLVLSSLPHCHFLPNSLATCNGASGYVARCPGYQKRCNWLGIRLHPAIY